MGSARGTEAYLAVGSNIDPETNVVAALVMLAAETTVTGVSTFYRTPPLARPEQDCYVNGIWRIVTPLGARDLKFSLLRPVERRLGRVRTPDAHAPRTIDLDIALFGDEVIDETDLRVPDPGIVERPFLAVPLLELAPQLRLPGTGVRLADQPVSHRTGALEAMPALTIRLREVIRT